MDWKVSRCRIFFAAITFLECFLLSQTAPHPQKYDSFIRTNLSRKSPLMPPKPAVGDEHHLVHQQRHARETQVQTTTGTVRGVRRPVFGKDVYVYYGIPFAEPPLGPLRFQKPVPIAPWTGVLNAFYLPMSCYQERLESFPGFRGEEIWNPNTNVSEDCLYLNLWVPKSGMNKMKQYVKNSPTGDLEGFKGLPILIWIYGGGYMSGTTTLDLYNADILAGENDVIVAAMNYRVGAFGFLYLGIEAAPGNQGMYDQMVAMNWVKENALKFGGDPESITLFGESAGAGSVSFHLLSPLSRHLVTRGILESGTMNAPWSVNTAVEAKQIAVDLSRDCECNQTQSEEEMVACLLEIPANTISTLQWNGYKNILAFPSAPVVDGEFLPRHPLEMLRDGDFKRTELLIGSNQNEGTYFLLYDFLKYFNKENNTCLERSKFLEIINQIFPHRSLLEKEAILFQYTHWEDTGDKCKNSELLGDLIGDVYFICPTNYYAQSYSDHGVPVYYYFFTQRTSSNPWGDWMGVLHADEIEYVFGQPLNYSQSHSRAEKELSRRVMQYFVRFAATGNPADENVETWPLYTRAEPNYFILNAETRGIGKGPRAKPCAFWNEFMPLITPGTASLPSGCGRERWDINAVSTGRSNNPQLAMTIILSTSVLVFSHHLLSNFMFLLPNCLIRRIPPLIS